MNINKLILSFDREAKDKGTRCNVEPEEQSWRTGTTQHQDFTVDLGNQDDDAGERTNK